METLEEKIFSLQRLNNNEKKSIVKKARTKNYNLELSVNNFEGNPKETLVALVGELISRTDYDNIKNRYARMNFCLNWKKSWNKKFQEKHPFASEDSVVMKEYTALLSIAWGIYNTYAMPSPKKQLEKECNETKRIKTYGLSKKEIRHRIDGLPPYAKRILEEETGRKYGSTF